MKKIISLIASLVLVIGCILGLTACGNTSDKKLKVISVNLTDEKYAFAVNKNNSTLLTSVNNYLTTIKDNGTFNTIINKYQDEDKTNYVSYALGSGNPTDNDLVVLTNTNFGNFEFVGNEENGLEDGKYYGIDMEIASGIAQSLNKNLFIVEWVNFDTILNQFQTYPNAIVMAGLSINPERQEIVDFSSEYYSAGQAIIALESDNTFNDCTTIDQVNDKLKSLSNVAVGYQNGTTAADFLKDYTNITATGYTTATLAAQALVNGSIKYVVVDNSPADSIVKSLNTINK